MVHLKDEEAVGLLAHLVECLHIEKAIRIARRALAGSSERGGEQNHPAGLELGIARVEILSRLLDGVSIEEMVESRHSRCQECLLLDAKHLRVDVP